jgi:hypothetical protein
VAGALPFEGIAISHAGDVGLVVFEADINALLAE